MELLRSRTPSSTKAQRFSLLQLLSLRAPTHVPLATDEEREESEQQADHEDTISCSTEPSSTTTLSTPRSSTASTSQTTSILSASILTSVHSLAPAKPSNAVLELPGGVFAAPEATMAQKDREAWPRIKSRLEDTILNLYRPKPGVDSTLSIEFMMAGPSPSGLKPSVIIGCGNTQCQRKLKKIIKTQEWITEHDYHFIVIVDPTRKLSGGDSNSVTMPLVKAWSRTSNSLCGALAHSRSKDGETINFTIGGVITVDEAVYALTVGHVFGQDNIDSGVGSEASEEELNAGRNNDSQDSDSEDGNDNGSPFVDFTPDPGTSEWDAAPKSYIPRSSGESLKSWSTDIDTEDRALHIQVDGAGVGEDQVVVGSLHAPLHPLAQSTLDWALIRMDIHRLPSWNRNEFRLPGSLSEQVIVGSVSDADLYDSDASPEIWVKCGVSGLKKGRILTNPASLFLQGRFCEAWQVQVDSPLVPGDSGAWVIRNGEVCGHIIAGRNISPFAYMLSMDTIFGDIKLRLGASAVAISVGNGSFDDEPSTKPVAVPWSPRIPIPEHPNGKSYQDAPGSSIRRLWSLTSVDKRLLLTGFFVSLSLNFTQVPIFYAFYLMVCSDYYTTHPSLTDPTIDRCIRDDIAAGTAAQFSILGITTTLCGTISLFAAGWTTKRFGPRLALMVHVFVTAIRVLTQILGVKAGGKTGIIVFQCTQLITVVAAPGGYISVLKIIAGEVVDPARQTAVFRLLQVCIMLGQSIGILTGAMIGDAFGIQRPFEIALCFFLMATAYVRLALPYITPESMSDSKKSNVKRVTRFLALLRVVIPRKMVLPNGRVVKRYGPLLLCSGVFLSQVTTGYTPVLLQIYATTVFRFHLSDSGWLVSCFAFIRTVLLILLFPNIIAKGRRWYLARHVEPAGKALAVSRSNRRNNRRSNAGYGTNDETEPLIRVPTRLEEIEASIGAEEEPVTVEPSKEDKDRGFDLFFLRWSLVVNSIFTVLTAFVTQKWHIYLASFLLPFTSGTAAAATIGVMMEMCSFAKLSTADAQSAVMLVENIARLSMHCLFGFGFAALARVGRANLTFCCNAAIALLAAAVLVFSRFAPEGSQPYVEELEEGERPDEDDGET